MEFRESSLLKLRDWIPLDKLDWKRLSSNPAAIHLLEKNMSKVNWIWLSRNPAAIHLLEKNLNKVDWWWLSSNPAAIHLLEKNLSKVDWGMLISKVAQSLETQISVDVYNIILNTYAGTTKSLSELHAKFSLVTSLVDKRILLEFIPKRTLKNC
jgi:hypothetical protein